MNAAATHDHPSAAAKPGYDAGARIFIWLAWLVAFGFWALSVATAFGILAAMANPAPTAQAQELGAGGIGFSLITIIAVAALGIAMAWAAFQYATRDKRMDPITEQATEDLYDAVEAAGGDDAISTSPEAEKRGEAVKH